MSTLGEGPPTAAPSNRRTHPSEQRYSVDHDAVKLYLLLAGNRWTWTPTTQRWVAREACRDFAAGIEWDGDRVLQALIVDAE